MNSHNDQAEPATGKKAQGCAGEATAKRLEVPMSPLDDAADITFEELFNLDDLQRLQDDFARATRVASIITRPDGTPLTAPSGFCRLCSDIIRKTDRGRANCYQSDAVIGQPCAEGPTIQLCMSGGLWDAGAGISVGGRHIANWLIGQVRDATQTEEKMRAYARQIGADETAMIEAFREVPAMSHEQFGHVARVLFTLTGQLSTTAYQNVQQARFIAERKRVEAALQESEKKHRLLFESAGDAIYIHDAASRMLAVNHTACEWLGYPHAELMSMTVGQVDTPEEARLAPERIARLLAAGHHTFETLHRRRDGGAFPVEVNARRITWEGRPAVMSICRDITGRKQAQSDVIAQRDLSGKYLQIAGVMICVLNSAGDIVLMNKKGLDILGYENEQALLGKNWFNISLPDNVVAEIKGVFNQLMSGDIEPVEYYENPVLTKNGGQRIMAFHNSILQDKENNITGILFSGEDITERKQMAEKLQQAQKMETVGRLAGGVAHDFNNMLNIIMGYADMALETLPPSDPLRENIREIISAGQRATEVVRKLLAFASKQTIAPKVLDLNDTVTSMLKMLRRLIGEAIDLRWKPAGELWPVKIDPSQIDQLLANLAVNARDAIQDVGAITIETANVPIDTDHGKFSADVKPGDYVMLAVSDDGCGMDGETLTNIFEPFFTTKEFGKGTGLGLATVHGIVKQNDGGIDVSSEPGKGSTFRIYLPRYRATEATAGEAPLSAGVPSGVETVLLAEDDPVILRLATAMLQRLGYTVLAADTPQAAVRLAREHAGEIHLLVTDVIMPEMNGRDLAKELRTRYPTLKSLFMSGYTADVIAHHGILDEGMHFIQKPFSKKELATKVREALGRI